MTCEAKQRKKIKTILPFDFLAEDAMFTFTQKKGGNEIRSAPCIQVPDLCGLVKWLLETNDR